LLELEIFDACKNAVTPIIVILGCSEIDTEVSDAGMETIEFNDCREMSKDNKDANGMLTAT